MPQNHEQVVNDEMILGAPAPDVIQDWLQFTHEIGNGPDDEEFEEGTYQLWWDILVLLDLTKSFNFENPGNMLNWGVTIPKINDAELRLFEAIKQAASSQDDETKRKLKDLFYSLRGLQPDYFLALGFIASNL
jgi:hypothetical protein